MFRTAVGVLIALVVSTGGVLAQPVQSEGEGLRVLAARRGFHIGAAVNMRPFRVEPAYREALEREFNVLVAENAFKFSLVRPARGRYEFADTDALVEYAHRHGLKVRGHTLVWHEQLPAWLTKSVTSRDEAIALLREHIATMMGRYRGRIWAWDVVNEAVANDGASLRKESFWYRTIGPDYIELAFRLAREADPQAKLYYNDFDAEDLGAKSSAVYELVCGLKSRGVPIDGVGWQMHVKSGFRVTDDHRANARRLAELGLELSVTELDVRLELPSSPERLEAQAESYRDVAAFCVSEPSVVALVMWGFTDRYSWVPGFFKGAGAALPFDEEYRPKPAYYALREALGKPPGG